MSSYQKRLAARMLKCGVNRVWIDPHNSKIKQAITRKDLRRFIKEGFIKKLPEKKKAKGFEKTQQKRGSIKGSSGARIGKKTEWLKIVRPQRKLLKELKGKKSIDSRTYRIVYSMVKGGAFRNKRHLLTYLEENKLMKREGNV